MSSSLLSRVEVVEQRIAGGPEEEKQEFLPKLAELRDQIQTFEETYEYRLAAVQERNRQALANLAKLQERVARRASAQAELEARAEAEKATEALRAQKEAQKAKPKARRKSAEVPRVTFEDMQVPRVTFEDMQVLMQAVGLPSEPLYAPFVPLPTPECWDLARCAESPFIPQPTPECWDDRRSLLLRPIAVL